MVANFDFENIGAAVEEALKAGVDPLEIIDLFSDGAREVGEKYEKGELYLSELVMVGETLKAGMEVLEPAIKGAKSYKAVMVLGTVEGDLHDIGKNVFGMLARGQGFRVVDLGVDVNKERFVQAVKENDASIVGISCLLTTTMLNVPGVIEELERQGLRGKVRVIVGGAPVTDDWAKQIGADAGTNDAVEGLEVCNRWV
jgi:methylmalonyl-CoA mutase cobalamin-binding domain/chain